MHKQVDETRHLNLSAALKLHHPDAWRVKGTQTLRHLLLAVDGIADPAQDTGTHKRSKLRRRPEHVLTVDADVVVRIGVLEDWSLARILYAPIIGIEDNTRASLVLTRDQPKSAHLELGQTEADAKL